MRYSELSPAPKLTVRRPTAIAMFEHEGLLARMERHGWITPLPIEGAQTAFYLVEELEAASRRLKAEKLPV